MFSFRSSKALPMVHRQWPTDTTHTALAFTKLYILFSQRLCTQQYYCWCSLRRCLPLCHFVCSPNSNIILIQQNKIDYDCCQISLLFIILYYIILYLKNGIWRKVFGITLRRSAWGHNTIASKMSQRRLLVWARTHTRIFLHEPRRRRQRFTYYYNIFLLRKKKYYYYFVNIS